LISDTGWFFGDKLNKLDISILPFIRQYRIANPDWFDSQEDLQKIRRILNNFLASELFKEIMHNYDVWRDGSELVYFPLKNLQANKII